MKTKTIKFVFALLKHPLLVAIVTILLGGFGLNYIQLRNIKEKADIDKRFAIAEEVVNYTAKTVSVLRIISYYDQGRRDQGYSRDNIRINERMMQLLINEIFEAEFHAETNLALYFNKNEVLLAFIKLKEDYHKTLDNAFTDIKHRKNPDNAILSYCNVVTVRVVDILNTMDLPIKKINAVYNKSNQ